MIKIKKQVDKVVQNMCAGILALLVGCVVYQVIARFVFNSPNTNIDEFSQILFTWLILIGGVYAISEKKHLAIDLIKIKLSNRGNSILTMFILMIISLFSILFLLYGGWIMVAKSAQINQLSPALGWPMSWVYMVMPISGVILIFYCICQFQEELTRFFNHNLTDPVLQPESDLNSDSINFDKTSGDK